MFFPNNEFLLLILIIHSIGHVLHLSLVCLKRWYGRSENVHCSIKKGYQTGWYLYKQIMRINFVKQMNQLI